MLRSDAKMHRTDCICLDICQRIIPFRDLHPITLTYFIRSKVSNCIISEKRELEQTCEMTTSTWRVSNILAL